MRIVSALLTAALVLGCSTAAPGASPSAAAETTAPGRTTSVERPPDGVLTFGSESEIGWLGTYCWSGICLDAPVPPEKSALPSLGGSANELVFALADGSAFVEWSASYAETSGGVAMPLGEGGSSDPDATTQSPPLTEATFAAPPVGDWVVRFSWFGPAGDAAYAWHVIVE